MSDPRITPANARVAHKSLRGQVRAATFTAGTVMRVAAPLADLRCGEDTSRLDRQVIHGDGFRVLERHAGRAFGISDRGGYVGYIPEAALAPWQAPTHWVQVRATLGFAADDIKAPDPVVLTMGARVRVSETGATLARTVEGWHIPLSHLAPIEAPADDPVTQAETLIGTPYLWGGNSCGGIDCSGLVQAALIAAGLDCPGDADQQQAALGAPLPEGAPLRRGDLIFWPGHVGIMADADTLLHANGHSMSVCYEPLQAACLRIRAQGDGEVSARKRL